MRIIKRSTLVEFYSIKPDSRAALEAWHAEVRKADWTKSTDIKAMYRNVSILKRGRVVFNICGNKYRLLCWVNYERGIVYTKFVGTHAEYDRIAVEEYNGPYVKSSKKRN